MEHKSKVDGKIYDIGRVLGYDDNLSYDIVTIMYFPANDEMNNGKIVRMLDFYFGEYDYEYTEEIIKNDYEKGSKK